MTVKYPRLPTGPSPVGAAGVRALQRAGGDWQTKRPDINTVSRQQGEFQRVITQQDGWVSCGKVERSGLTGLAYVTPSWRVTGGTDGAKNRRGPSEFADLSIQTDQPRVIPENPIAYLADGSIYKLEFDGAFFPGSTSTAMLRLKGGYLPYGSGKLVASIAANQLPEFIPGAVTGGKWFSGVAHDMLTSTESAGYYTGFQVGGDTWTVPLLAISTGGLIPFTRRPTIHRISTRELVGFVPGFQSILSGPRGSRLVYSDDNGKTFGTVYAGSSLFTERIGYNPSDPQGWSSDSHVFEIRDRFLCASLPDGRLIAVVGEGAYTASKAGRSLRIYELGSGTTTTMLKDGSDLGESGTFSTVFKHGGHHHGRPFLQFVREESSIHYLAFVKVNGDGIDVQAMPQPSHWTGRARALDEKTIQCPMYFQAADQDPAGYYICTSDDFGVSWKKIRLIKEDDAAPPVIDLGGLKVNHTLQAFNDAFLPRRYGAPALTYPGAPWVGSYRQTPPWLE